MAFGELNNPCSTVAKLSENEKNEKSRSGPGDKQTRVFSQLESNTKSSRSHANFYKVEDIKKRGILTDHQSQYCDCILVKEMHKQLRLATTKIPEKKGKQGTQCTRKRLHMEDFPVEGDDIGESDPQKKKRILKRAGEDSCSCKDIHDSNRMVQPVLNCIPSIDSTANIPLKILPSESGKNHDSKSETEAPACSARGRESKLLCMDDHSILSNDSYMLTLARQKYSGTKVYFRKNCRKAPGIFNSLDSEVSEKEHSYNTEVLSGTTELKMANTEKPQDLNYAKENDLGKEARELCISTLLQHGLVGCSQKIVKVEHPGVTGDGSTDTICKVCKEPENKESWICDLCGKLSHLSCHKPCRVERFKDWYCSTCWKKKRKSITIPSRCKIESRYSYFLRQLRDAHMYYTPQVRIGNGFQADVTDSLTNFPELTESRCEGFTVSHEEMEQEAKLAKQKLKKDIWEKDWKPAQTLPQGSQENWLRCTGVLVSKGGMCSDGQIAKMDILCGKRRRAPLSVVQTEKWDCSCAVVWDPHHADCQVPQELDTAEIERRMEEYANV